MFLTIKEISEILRVSKRTAYNYLKDKKNPLPYIKFSRRAVRVKKEDFISWLKERNKQYERLD
jgi:excisionase family DNA binding protein